MVFWPGSVSPLAKPAQMWCVKFVLIDGRTAIFDGIQHMLLNRYIELSREPQNSRALDSISIGIMPNFKIWIKLTQSETSCQHWLPES